MSGKATISLWALLLLPVGPPLLGLDGARAWAAEPARLVYLVPQSAERCPSERALIDAIAARLGYDPFRPRADRTLRAAIQPGSSYTAQLELYDHKGLPLGRRSLGPSPDCAGLLDPLALAAALALDPLQLGGPPEPSREPAPKPATAVPTSTLALTLAAAPIVSFGTLPHPSVGGRIELGLQGDRFGISVEGAFEAPASLSVSGGRISAFTLTSGLSGCLRVGPASGCLIGRLGALRASGERLINSSNSSSLYATLGIRGRYQWTITPAWALAAAFELATPLTRIELVDSANGATFWTTPALQGILALEARFSLPW